MDSEGVLRSYLRDKGAADLVDKNLLEVLKELLRKENHGICSNRVEECTHIAIDTLPLNSILLGNVDHFERVDARELVSPSESMLITGVIVRSSSEDRIVDGYHRLKYSLDRGLLDGTFVVISKTDI
jgi:hypothetical protein